MIKKHAQLIAHHIAVSHLDSKPRVVRHLFPAGFAVELDDADEGRDTIIVADFSQFLEDVSGDYPTEDKLSSKEHPRFLFVKHPVQQEDGKWYAADVKRIGYSVWPTFLPFNLEADCQSACDAHNRYVGYATRECDGLVNIIINRSMAGQATAITA
jgi:hypothetical protein